MVQGLTRRGFLPVVSDGHRMAPAGSASGRDLPLIALEAMACLGGGHLWLKA